MAVCLKNPGSRNGSARGRRARLPVAARMLVAVALCAAPALVQAEAPPGGAATVFHFQGYGRAHGVGMCMDGVYYRAREGQDYRTILNYYYTGVTFSTTDDNRPIRVKGRDGQIRVLSMHDYLYHLQEEPDSYPLEELKALYVAARTYTLSCIARNKHTAQGFDICSSGECCQAFDENKNVAAYPNCNAAVDATAGQILTYNGQPITAAYCGSCGGHTENNEDVWGGAAIPYLRGKPDEYCCHSKRFAWTADFTRSDVEARLNSRVDTAIGSLYAVDLSHRTPGGRVKTARLVGSAGVRTVPGEVIRALFGFSSTKFDLVQANFDEYVLVYNPSPRPTVVTFTFMKPDGSTADHVQEVTENSRYTLKVNDFAQFQETSIRVVSERPVIAERAMYFDCRNVYTGGSASIGMTAPRASWYMAEGYTGPDFETYVLVQNPAPEAAQVKYTFMLPKGRQPVVISRQVAPCSRATLRLNDVPGLENTDVSTLVESEGGTGIVAERSMYFNYHGIDGGHNAMGVPRPSTTWHLPEGYTGGTFDTYILLQNPTGKNTTVTATYMKEGGENVVRRYPLGAHSRYTVHADEVPGLDNAGFSTRLESAGGVGIVAEHALYFDYGSSGRRGGSCEAALAAASGTWYFAEGYTGGDFDTYILVENPGDKAARIRVTYNNPRGGGAEKDYTVRPRSRYTIHVNEIPGLESTEVATAIRSLNGVEVVAERAVYFVYTNGYCARAGGHLSTGATEPSRTWYFAEGYTGL